MDKLRKNFRQKSNDDEIELSNLSASDSQSDSVAAPLINPIGSSLGSSQSLPRFEGKMKSLELIYYNILTSLRYVLKDTISHKRNWGIGFFTVLLVVVFTLILENSIQRSPIIFLKLQEDNVGEYDMLMTSNFQRAPTPFLNGTWITIQTEEKAPHVSGTAPRWVMIGRANNPRSTGSSVAQNTSATFLMIDSAKERKIGLGRAWDHRDLGPEEVHVSEALLKFIGIQANKGQKLEMVLDLLGLSAELGVTNSTTTRGFEGLLADLLEQTISQRLNLGEIDFQNTTLRNFIEKLRPVLQDNVEYVPDVLEILFPGQVNLDGPTHDFFLVVAAKVHELLIIRRQFSVIDSVGDPAGKFPKALGNVVLMDTSTGNQVIKDTIDNFVTNLDNYKKLLQSVSLFQPQLAGLVANVTSAINSIQSQASDFEDRFDVQEFAFSLVLQYSNRFTAYLKDSDGLNEEMLHWTDEVADAVGTDFPSTVTLPLKSALAPVLFLRLMLDQVFTVVEFILMGLGALLIYSLLISNVDEKTYEYGMLRALGMRHYSLISLLTFQSLLFSIPAIFFGLFIGWLLFLPIEITIADYSVSPRDFSLYDRAVWFAVTLGIVMPLISLVGPVGRALSHTLRDALDVYHQVQSETTVSVMRLENMGLSPWQLMAATLMTVCGFVVYYVIPYSFTFRDFSLFFFILTCIMVGMILGLSFLSQTVQPYVERWLVWVIIWGDDRRCLSALVKKNLLAHGKRNSKTGIMFTTALSFIIFAGSSFTLQGQTIQDTLKLYFGGDVVVNPPFVTTVSLPQAQMREFLDQTMETSKAIEGYTFVAGPLGVMEGVSSVLIENLVQFPPMLPLIYGVERNYLKESYNEFFLPSAVLSGIDYQEISGEEDVIASLFDSPRAAKLPYESDYSIDDSFLSQTKHVWTEDPTFATGLVVRNKSQVYEKYLDVVLSDALQTTASLNTKQPVRLQLSFHAGENSTKQLTYLGKPRAFVQTMEGFLFSSYRETAFVAPLLISMDQYYEIMTDIHNNSDPATRGSLPSSPEKRILIVNLKHGTSDKDKEIVINGLRNYIDNDFIQIFDTQYIVDSTFVALELLNFFFELVSTIAIVLSFFVLWLSFTANVRENAWEFSVLRAVGLNSWQLVRCYIYEALCVVLSSVLLALIIGVSVSTTITLQFDLFTQLPFKFNFPTTLFFFVFAMSLGVAVVGSYIPSRRITTKSVASALKHL